MSVGDFKAKGLFLACLASSSSDSSEILYSVFLVFWGLSFETVCDFYGGFGGILFMALLWISRVFNLIF